MECNKDEALRAKEIALKKLAENDISGAKKLAVKAQNLYPGLEGISQMLTILDVYTSAERKVLGEMDWYGILGVSPLADDETIKKHYKKLALLLHPDKNKSLGADVAFQFVSQAFSFLSDKIKRSDYNQRLNIRPSHHDRVSAPHPGSNPFQKKVLNRGGVSFVAASKSGGSALPAQNGHYRHSTPEKKQPSGNWTGPPPPTTSSQGRNSFWTVCDRCRMQYEYLRRYLNQILLCPHCKKGFKAVETAPPSNLSTSSRWVHQQQHQKSSQISWPRLSGDRNNHTNSQWGPFFGGTASGTAASSLPAANQAAAIGQTGDDNGKRDRGAVSDVGEDPSRKRRVVDDELLRTVSGSNCRSSMNGELSQLKTRNMLMRKTVIEISKKLHQWRSAREEKQKAKQNERQQPKLGKNIDTPGVNEQGSPVVGSSSGASGFVTERTAVKMVSINVPDSDFHDFDTDRSEFSFADNDVWAAYDTDEGMPRFYALIHKVISVNPFKIRFSWLNSKSNSELGPVDWIGCGFTKTCGEFRIGRHETYESLNSFSHKVKWTKGPRGVIRVYPAKGEIWALYRNWSPDWNEETPEEERHAYEMAEVVDDYAEDQGVTVASLVKVPGFKTVYRRWFNDKERRTVPKGEMFRFSHRVPSHPLTGEQAPSGCLELDPAATPVSLLQESS